MLMHMASSVKFSRPDVAQAVRELAALKGVSLTAAVGDAVRSELLRAQEIDRRLRDVRCLVEEFNALPRVGPMLTDDDLYDEDGLPK